VGLRVQHRENKDTYECWHRNAEQEHIADAEQRSTEVVTESTDRIHGSSPQVERCSGKCCGLVLLVCGEV
jgi:hypothetical protein